MNNSEPSLAPSSTLTAPATAVSDELNSKPNRFIVFTESWLGLQTYIQQGLKLPINQGEFRSKYGDFSREETIKGCLSGMKSIHDLSSTFGAPKTVKEQIIKNPDFLVTKTPPDEIYGHMIWLANQIQNSANTFSYTIGDLIALLRDLPERERAASVRTILMDRGGLVSTADEMKGKTQDLIKKVLDFDLQFTNANDKITQYTGSSSSILADANQAIGQLTTTISDTQQSAADAYSKWKKLTIAAVSAPIGIMILTGGLCLIFPPAAAAIAVTGTIVAMSAAVGLGVAASNAIGNYNKLMADVRRLTTQKQQKTLLVTDLTGLNTNILQVAPALTTFKKNLEEITGVWNDVSMNLAYICNNYSDQQLGDLTWLNQAMKINVAQAKWKEIASTTQNFTQNSLVNYDTSINFGDTVNVAAA